jgi:hypothetical protein
MGMRWELLDAIFIEDAPGSLEFGMALRRSPDGAAPELLAARLGAAWAALGVLSAVAEGHRLAAAEAHARLSRLASLPGYGLARRLYRLRRRLGRGAR